jgi:hypothetical protein
MALAALTEGQQQLLDMINGHTEDRPFIPKTIRGSTSLGALRETMLAKSLLARGLIEGEMVTFAGDDRRTYMKMGYWRKGE